MSTAITAIYCSATATVTDYPTRIRGISWGTHGTAGDLVVRNASASGDIVYKQTLTSGTNSDVYIPDLGVRVKTKIHVTLPTSAAATLLIG